MGGCCGTTPEHMAAVVERLAPFRTQGTTNDSNGPARVPTEREAGVAFLYQHMNFDQNASYLAIGERTNSNGSKAFRVGRDGVADMKEIVSRCAQVHAVC